MLTTSKNAEKAKAFNDFLYTPEAQRLWAEAGFRPVDPTVAAEFADDFPQPEKLWTIADLGGWKNVDGTLFKKDVGRHRQDLRRGHPVGAMTTTTVRRGATTSDPSTTAPPAGAPPTREGRRRPARPGRALGVGVVGLWLSVIVLLPLAALTVHSLDDGLGRLLGGGDGAGRARRPADDRVVSRRRRPRQRRHGHARRVGARA